MLQDVIAKHKAKIRWINTNHKMVFETSSYLNNFSSLTTNVYNTDLVFYPF